MLADILGDIKSERSRIVIHFKNGKLLKGYTQDFVPAKRTFHIISQGKKEKETIHEVKNADLKAIFFVKTFTGNKNHVEKKKFDEVDSSHLKGLKVKVKFNDGEVIKGVSFDYSKKFNGFFITPVDPECNNEKLYALTDALQDIKIDDAAEA